MDSHGCIIAKFVTAMTLGALDIVLFTSIFVTAVLYHHSYYHRWYPTDGLLLLAGPIEVVTLAFVARRAWRAHTLRHRNGLLCGVLAGECLLNWAIFAAGGGLFALFLGL